MKKTLAKILSVAMALGMFAPMSAMAYTEYTLNAKLVGGDNTYTWEKSDVGSNEYLAPRLFSMIVADKQNMKDQFAEDGNLDALCEIANAGITAYQGGDDTWAEWVDDYTVDGTADELLLADKTTKISDLGEDNAATITYTHGGTDYTLTVTYTSREISGGGSSGGSSSGGSSSGGGSVTTPEEPDEPVVTPEVTVTGGQANVTIDDTVVDSLTEIASKNDSQVVTIAPVISGNANAVSVDLTVGSVERLATETTADLAITNDIAGVTFENAALQAIADQAGDKSMDSDEKLTVIIESDPVSGVQEEIQTAMPGVSLENATATSVDAFIGETPITHFGGAALTLHLPATAQHVNGRSYLVIAVSDDGTVTTHTGLCMKDAIVTSTTHLTTFVVTNEEVSSFTDVAYEDYFHDAVLWAYDNEITSGISETQFGSDAVCTREQAVTFLWKAAGAPAVKNAEMPFTDVDTDDYFYNAVLWAKANGITAGISDTEFGVGVKCAREQIVTFLFKAAKGEAVEGEPAFTDVTAEDYFYNPVLWAKANEITAGVTETEFGVGQDCTRAQIVTFLWKTYAK